METDDLECISSGYNYRVLLLEALREHLLEKHELYQDDMAASIWDEFEVLVSTHSISRALTSIG